MPGAGAIGLAGFAGVPQGYMAMNTQMTDQLALEALGRGLQAMSGIGTQPTSPTQPTAPAYPGPAQPAGLVPRLIQSAGQGIGQLAQGVGQMFSGGPAASPPPPGSFPRPPGGPGPGLAPAPQPGPGMMRPPPSPPSFAGGGGGLPQGNPNPGFPAMPGGAGGPQLPHSMDWRDVTRAVVAANPGAGPDVIAAAVSKAMPLMNADSQAQWRAIQLQMQEQGLQLRAQSQADTARYREESIGVREQALSQGTERLRQGQERIDQAARREDRLRENMQWVHDQKATELQMKAQAARDKVTQFGQNMDLKQRQQALKEMDQHQRAYDAYARSKINAAANLNGQDKKDALKQLDTEWGEYDQQRRTLQEQLDRDAQGGNRDQNFQRGKDIIRQGGGQAFGPAPGDTAQGTAMPAAVSQKLTSDIAAHPELKEQLIQAYKQKGWIVPDGL